MGVVIAEQKSIVLSKREKITHVQKYIFARNLDKKGFLVIDENMRLCPYIEGDNYTLYIDGSRAVPV